MKKLFLMAGLLVGLCACQEETPNNVSGGEFEATVSAVIPDGMTTRNQADPGNGSEVNRCIMEIYKGDQLYGTRQYATVADGKASFNVRLITGQEYQFVFWADKGGGTDNKQDLYYETTDLHSVKIANYSSSYVGNNDARDAFYGGETVTADATKAFEVQLKRPFGQINMKTTDLASIPATEAPAKVKVTYQSVNTQFNVLTGEASDPQNVSYTANADVMNKEGYLVMDYVFAPNTEDYLINFSTEFFTEANAPITKNEQTTNIPVRRNYRTNITGNLLSKNADITVIVKPGFDGDLNPVWDGETLTAPEKKTVKVDDGTGSQTDVEAYVISEPAELAWFAAQVNGTATTRAGEDMSKANLYLTADIDLGGQDWTPIGERGLSNWNVGETDYQAEVKFSGSVYGNGHTIRNAVINTKAVARGIIGQVFGDEENPSVIRDLHAENVVLKNSGKWSGGLVGYVRNVKEISDCSIKDVTIEAGDCCTYASGGLIGYITTTKDITIENCSSENVEISNLYGWCNGGFIGKIFGCGNVTIKNCQPSKGYFRTSLYLGGSVTHICNEEGTLQTSITYGLAHDGYNNSWFIGNLCATTDQSMKLNLRIENVDDNSSNWTEMDCYGNMGNIIDKEQASAYAWPYVNCLDNYALTAQQTTSKITVVLTNGKEKVVFPKN